MKLKDIKTLGILGIGAFALHKVGFFKNDFFLWNMGKTEQFSSEALAGVREGAKESTQDAIKQATGTLDTGARMFIPPYAWVRSVEDLRGYFEDLFNKQKTTAIPTLQEEERVYLAPRTSDIPNNTSDLVRHIQEATGSTEPTGERRTTNDIQPATKSQTLSFFETRANLIQQGLSFQDATNRAREIN